LQTSPRHIAQQLRSKLPEEQKETGWGYLAVQFPWFSLLHLLRAADHPEDSELLSRAALYQDNILRLHTWLNEDGITVATQPDETAPEAATGAASVLSAAESIPLPPHRAPETAGSEEDEEREETDGEPEGPAIKMPDLSKILNAPVSQATGLAFEPFHTVDYFASQGIKVEKEANKQVTTQLDQQVKSFTDWLKSMKKLSYQPATTYTDPLVDAQARSSLNKKEIVTEAMAEVWIKQGHYDMAAQVFAKLMLQHPEKTPYFAARLQDLKEKQ
jgi:hypothetical protein